MKLWRYYHKYCTTSFFVRGPGYYLLTMIKTSVAWWNLGISLCPQAQNRNRHSVGWTDVACGTANCQLTTKLLEDRSWRSGYWWNAKKGLAIMARNWIVYQDEPLLRSDLFLDLRWKLWTSSSIYSTRRQGTNQNQPLCLIPHYRSIIIVIGNSSVRRPLGEHDWLYSSIVIVAYV
jgi:hypothetical protein